MNQNYNHSPDEYRETKNLSNFNPQNSYGKERRAFAIASAVMGIMGIIFFTFTLSFLISGLGYSLLIGIVGTVLGILAIVFAVISRAQNKRFHDMALVGLIFGIIIAVFLAVAVIIGIASAIKQNTSNSGNYGSSTNGNRPPYQNGETLTPADTDTPDSGSNSGDNIVILPGGEQYPLPPKQDLDGYVYNAFVRSGATGNDGFYTEDFWVDPASGGADSLSFAVIKRNTEIERDFNCSIRMTQSTLASQYQEMIAYFESDQKFELAILLATDAATCATGGLLSDIKADINTKNMDLSHEAFDQNSIEQLTIGGSLYYLSGDMNISTMDNTACTVFNTLLFQRMSDRIVEALGDEMYGDVYQMVADGKWTIDNMMKIASVVTYDADPADGTLRHDKGDMIGYYEYAASPLYYYYGSGMRITDNLDGYPDFTINTDNAAGAYNYIFETFNINLHPDIPSGKSGDRADSFQTGGVVLFTDYILWDVRRILYPSETDVSYGILPIATYEENAEHHSVVYFQNCAHLWTIPYKRNSVDNSAFIMYVMAAYSGKPDSTMDAYYIKTIYMNVARDDGSRASLDIIKDSLEYDIALIYDWGNFDELILDAGTATSKQYDTYLAVNAMKQAESLLQETLDLFYQVSEGSGSEA